MKITNYNKADHFIRLNAFSSPAAVLKYFKNFVGLCGYAYEFHWRNQTIKIGKSADLSGRSGDRAYRQAGHINGWHKPLIGGSGSDILVHIANFENKHKVKVDVKDVSISIWTGFHLAGSQGIAAAAMEGDLLEQYKDIHGTYPIGNIRISKKKQPAVEISTFNMFFNKPDGG